MTRRIDLSGQRYGRLTIVKQSTTRKHRSVVWECLCDCGTKCRALGTNIANGNTRSCGCLRRETSVANAYRPRQKDKSNPPRIRPTVYVAEKKWAGAEDAASTLAALMGLAA